MAWGDTGGGYSFRTTAGGRDVYSPVNELNRAQNLKNLASKRTYADRFGPWGIGSPGGGGRSLMDAAQGRSWQGVTTPRFAQQTFGGDQGRSGQGNVYRPSGVHPGITGITATDPGQEFIMRTGAGAAEEDEIDRKRKFDHPWYEHMRLPSMDILGKVGDLAKGALRGSRLHSSYKDAAVAAGGTKAEGSKAWERDKKMMVPSWDLKRGDAGYEGSDKQFYDKYMNLADMAQDNEKAQEYRDTAETAWRNKQTSDRLAAASGFEGYDPGKYSGVGEGSRYTGGHRQAGEFVPGVDIMRGLREKYQGFRSPQDYETGEHWDIAPDAGFAQGYEGNEYDLENQIKLLENQIFPGEDITSDLDDYYTEGELPEDTSMLPGLTLDDIYERGEMMPDEQYSTWGDPGFYNERSRFGNWKDMDRKFGDLSKRNSGFISPFTRKGGLPFGPNVGMNYVDEDELDLYR